jgi:hypothetical protein
MVVSRSQDVAVYILLAEGAGFEPALAEAKTVFKTVTIVHSVTPPQDIIVYFKSIIGSKLNAQGFSQICDGANTN